MDASATPAAMASCCLSAAFVELRRGGTDSISPAAKRRRLNAKAVAAQGLTERIETSSPSREARKYTEKLRPQLEHPPEPAPQVEPAPKTKQSLALEVTLLRSLLKAKQEAEKKKQHELLVALQCTAEDDRPAQPWAAGGTASLGSTQRATHSTVDGVIQPLAECGRFGREGYKAKRVVGKWAILVTKLDAQRSLVNEDVALDLRSHGAVTCYGLLKGGSKKTTRCLRRAVAIYAACSLWVEPGPNEEWLRGSVRHSLTNVGLEGEKHKIAYSQIFQAFAHLTKDIGSPWVFTEFENYWSRRARRQVALTGIMPRRPRPRLRDRRRACIGDGDDGLSEGSDELGLFFG